MQEILCKNLRYLRKKNKLTQESFADKIGINRSSYAYHEINGIPTKHLTKYQDCILREFGFSLEFLMKNDLQQGFSNNEAAYELEKTTQNLTEITDKLKYLANKIK